jgi:small-conductance mechanosensitive channel
VLHRFVSLQRARNSLAQLAWSTEALERDADADAQRIRDALRERSRALRAQVAPATTSADAPAPIDETRFRLELEILKQLGAALVPLRAEAAVLDRFSGDIRTWQRTIDRESRKALQELGLGVIGLVIGLGVIVIGALVWKVAANRYVKDPYRQRLVLRARKIVIAAAFVLLLVFHFTSELTALVTALGFAAAGIAFALQNVILAIAGYFSMMAPNGIRVGDRVSLQGPFGYVHGEVIEIGLVRVRLRELTADRLEPTGRTVVFPNSVMFTGSFFKHPAELPPAKAA